MQEKNTFLNSLNWRYAVKGFDTNQKVNDQDLNKIQESIRLAPSSFGLQPFRVIIVTDQETKAKLMAASYGQAQVGTASHLLVFVSNFDMQKRIGEYCDLVASKSGGLFDRIKAEATMRGFAMLHSDEGKMRWASEQAYVALGFALAACAELRIDSCPMGGFSAKDYKEILNLGDKEEVCVIMPIGYRTDECKFEKTRFSSEVLFQNI
jgi:nitroreductase / dihydropteridine reductase